MYVVAQLLTFLLHLQKKLNHSLLSSYLSQLCKCKNHNRLKVNKEINDINGINRMNRHILSK